MANRIVGNVYIIDSASTSAAPLQSGIAWPNHMKLDAVSFWTTSTAGICEFVYASNTNDTAFVLSPNVTSISVAGAMAHLHFGGVYFSELRVRTLTAGTAWLYFV